MGKFFGLSSLVIGALAVLLPLLCHLMACETYEVLSPIGLFVLALFLLSPFLTGKK
jgi:hypothetical protein